MMDLPGPNTGFGERSINLFHPWRTFDLDQVFSIMNPNLASRKYNNCQCHIVLQLSTLASLSLRLFSIFHRNTIFKAHLLPETNLVKILYIVDLGEHKSTNRMNHPGAKETCLFMYQGFTLSRVDDCVKRKEDVGAEIPTYGFIRVVSYHPPFRTHADICIWMGPGFCSSRRQQGRVLSPCNE